jgi:hypothetical protein
MGEKGAVLQVTVESLTQAERFGAVRAGETVVGQMAPKEMYRLNLLMGAPGKELNVQLSNLIYLNGNWRMLGPWVSDYLVKNSEKNPLE